MDGAISWEGIIYVGDKREDGLSWQSLGQKAVDGLEQCYSCRDNKNDNLLDVNWGRKGSEDRET